MHCASSIMKDLCNLKGVLKGEEKFDVKEIESVKI